VNEPLASVLVVPTAWSDRATPGRAMTVTVSPDEPATVPVRLTLRPYFTTLALAFSETCTDDERIAALWCEIDAAKPFAFVAVTTTRSVLPTSSEVGEYVSLFASVMLWQRAPVASQRTHWYAYVIGAAPFHVPLLAVSALPSIAEPVIAGRAVLTGAFVAAALMTAVSGELWLFVPAEFVAVTITRSRWPRSSEVRMSVWLWPASSMATQDAPPPVQRVHRYLNVIGAVPAHAPLWAVSTLPTTGAPVTVGRVVFCGGPVPAATLSAVTEATSAVARPVVNPSQARRSHRFLPGHCRCLLPPGGISRLYASQLPGPRGRRRIRCKNDGKRR
jgi:hypothetical protein